LSSEVAVFKNNLYLIGLVLYTRREESSRRPQQDVTRVPRFTTVLHVR